MKSLAFTAGISLLLAFSACAQDDLSPQAATPEDMRIFEPYIGSFRSESKPFDNSEVEYHFTISYQWFDKPKSIVKYVVAMEIPAQERTLVLSEGFYGYDPFNQQLYVFGAFTRGQSGWGTVGLFDHANGRRETWARSMTPDGKVVHVRDTFERLDDNHWNNKTYVRQGEEPDWKVVSEDHYTRVQP